MLSYLGDVRDRAGRRPTARAVSKIISKKDAEVKFVGTVRTGIPGDENGSGIYNFVTSVGRLPWARTGQGDVDAG